MSQSVKDALADAETLRLNDVTALAASDVVDAGCNGGAAIYTMRHETARPVYWAGRYAEIAASAAFRAVPGLR